MHPTLISIALFLTTVKSFQFSASLPFLRWDSTPSHRIAIIGAGAGGSSAAFWISRAQNRTQGHNLFVDVFEKESYIGGRSTVVYPYDSQEYDPIELGASIFVTANKNLMRATEEFNLSFNTLSDEDGELGIWDGATFRFRKNGQFSWWDVIRLLWRYGFNSPRRAQALVTNLIDQYLTLYDTSTPNWQDVANISNYLNFTNLTSQTTEVYLEAQGVSALYANEMVEGRTSMTFNINEIHALEGLVSQATSGASSVAGGNFQIFEQFLARSGAKVYLNTTVESLTRKGSKWVLVASDGESRTYDSVILAAPFHSTNITITPPLRDQIPKQPYVHLHVTLLTTSAATPKAAYYSLSDGTTAPNSVLTTNEGFESGGPEPEFNSLTYLKRTEGYGGRPAEYIVKIFSLKELDMAWLRKMFGVVHWVHRKEWDAYPQLPPTATFPSVVPDVGFYYVNSFEPFISTMETETVSSLNAVQLLLNKVYDVNTTTCSVNGTSRANGEIMKGWDC
ncbi:Prenylcysteine lyase-domain-containing protein [Hysterangium stoloniferum]|nr:Prenylcysteine lyase-domain-containing protein [Hysterangium stoloniferum]